MLMSSFSHNLVILKYLSVIEMLNCVTEFSVCAEFL